MQQYFHKSFSPEREANPSSFQRKPIAIPREDQTHIFHKRRYLL